MSILEYYSLKGGLSIDEFYTPVNLGKQFILELVNTMCIRRYRTAFIVKGGKEGATHVRILHFDEEQTKKASALRLMPYGAGCQDGQKRRSISSRRESRLLLSGAEINIARKRRPI